MGTKLQGPKDVGKEIIRNLSQSNMIEETPSLHSVGFVTFKILGKWMAKRIHRMLIEGIETWAPETLLERAFVDTFRNLVIGVDLLLDMLRAYGAEKLKAQWLLYVTPVAKQKYIEMCFTAAKGAKWLEPACATYVGYHSCTTKLSKLVYMLNEGKALHKVTAFVLRGNAANYSARDVLECAI
ncbi:hypothetical protein Tco_1198595 [Tanacetum coccineum]